MEIDAPEIVRLKSRVRAADEEFRTAMAFHEAWKPAAYDKGLHERLGMSYASNTFIVIRQALRREVFLALWRLWDEDDRAVDLTKIANAFGDKRTVDALASACAAQSDNLRVYPNPDISAEELPAVAVAVRESEIEYGRQQGEELRRRAAEVVQIVRRYQKSGEGAAVLEELTVLRHAVLAHRDTKHTIGIGDPDSFDERVEAFYQDMSRLIQLLRLVVENVSYDPEDTAEIYRKNAAYFWARVRGERTEGHPDYMSPPRASDQT